MKIYKNAFDADGHGLVIRDSNKELYKRIKLAMKQGKRVFVRSNVSTHEKPR